jgi:hypothetical protein
MDEKPEEKKPHRAPGKAVLMVWGTYIGFVLLIIIIGWLMLAARR